jgi:dihydrolipoamide dehydrogenase
VVIATGSAPATLTGVEFDEEVILSSTGALALKKVPGSLAVIGGGVIGLELGQALARKGVRVTGIEGGDRIASLNDEAANQTALDIMRREFDIWLGEQARISEQGDKLLVTAGEQAVEVDKVLVAIGRKPNLDKLGLDKLDLALDDSGMPRYNPNTMQLGDLPIYIAGDVNGDRQILHEAGDEGKIAGYNAAHGTAVAFRRKTPLGITFCDPNICTIGADWSELAGNDAVVVGEMKLGPVGRALIMGKNKGVIRVYGDKTNGRVLGATLVTVKGEHLAHLLAWAIQRGMTVYDMLRLPFYHPVIEEALQAALYDLLGKMEYRPEYKILELEELDND